MRKSVESHIQKSNPPAVSKNFENAYSTRDCFELTAVSYEGITLKTADGKAAHLAVIDEKGNIISSGKVVEDMVFDVSIISYKNLLKGSGHLKILASPSTPPHFEQ